MTIIENKDYISMFKCIVHDKTSREEERAINALIDVMLEMDLLGY